MGYEDIFKTIKSRFAGYTSVVLFRGERKNIIPPETPPVLQIRRIRHPYPVKGFS